MLGKSKKPKAEDSRLYNKNFIQACSNAVNGIVYCTTTQTNIRKQLVLGVIVMILSLFYDFSTAEFLCLTFAVFFVIFAEMLNTAIETIVDLLVDVYHPKAKIAKDVGAGAVVLTACNAIIVAYFLFFKETKITQISDSIFNHMVSSPTHLVFVGVMLVIISIVASKALSKGTELKTGNAHTFSISGQSAFAFAVLTAIWLTTRNPVVFCLSLSLSILVAGNRLNDKRSFGEVLFGAFMGMLIVLMVYGLAFFQVQG